MSAPAWRERWRTSTMRNRDEREAFIAGYLNALRRATQPQERESDMKRLLLYTAMALALATSAGASPWLNIPTGEWQCGPHVKVVVSIDGYGAMDFHVIGAWFNNHYTVRRGALFYNGIACAAVGNVWPPQPPVRKRTGGPAIGPDGYILEGKD